LGAVIIEKLIEDGINLVFFDECNVSMASYKPYSWIKRGEESYTYTHPR
jgi:hypothetical protein